MALPIGKICTLIIVGVLILKVLPTMDEAISSRNEVKINVGPNLVIYPLKSSITSALKSSLDIHKKESV